MHTSNEITLDETSVHILWDDGHRSSYAHRSLRGACGCAVCVEEATGRRIVGYEDVPADVETVDWIKMGRYALQFLFSDFHQTGIFPFNYLRSLCTCEHGCPE